MSKAGRPSILVKEMYNEHIKREFINEGYENEGTIKIIEYLFYRSREVENYLGKDIYDFSLDDVKTLLESLNSPSEPSLRANISHIRSYMHWAVDNGYRAVVDLPLEKVSSEWIEQLIPEFQRFFSKDDIDKILEKVVNYQDKALILLIFEGVNGHGMSEVLNLKKSDINWDDNLLYLTCDKYGKRDKPLRCQRF